MRRVLKEPLLHFFVIGALLFIVHGALSEDPRTIEITPELRAELARSLTDRNGRKPSSAELQAELDKWRREEALFREALREGLDRDDAVIRAALVGKMYARAGFEAPKREPTEAELESWLASRREVYALPVRYDFEFLAFPKSEPEARAELEKVERAVAQGANPAELGRSLIGGNLAIADMKDRVDAELVARMPTLPQGEWQRIETPTQFLLARVKRVEGGVPPFEELRERLKADWSFAARQEAVERIVDRTVQRYRFEELP